MKTGTPNALLINTMIRYTYKNENNQYIFNIELPGKSKEDINLSVIEDFTLKLAVKKEVYHIATDLLFDPSKLDFSSVKASMKNGLLTIKVPSKKGLEKTVEIE